jgi:site-specific DNA recombinase
MSTVDVPQEEWYPIPVPAIVEPEVVAAVQEQVQEHRRHARQSRRGALSWLQGLRQCQHCGYAYDGKRLSPSARKGKPRAYAYDRCLGTDAYRVGGERVCQNTQVRTDRLDLAVWQEVCTLLAHPERLAEEYRRRLPPETRTPRPPLAALEEQLGKVRQGVARVIDSYADGLIDKGECEPRMLRLRQRMARLEEQRQQLAEEATLHTELQLIIGRLEDFAAKVHGGLEEADWASKRDLIRTLVKRVEVARDQVNIVFRVDPYAGDPDPEKKSWQLCRRSSEPPVSQHIPPRTGYVYGIHVPELHKGTTGKTKKTRTRQCPLRQICRGFCGVLEWNKGRCPRHKGGTWRIPQHHGADVIRGQDESHPCNRRL